MIIIPIYIKYEREQYTETNIPLACKKCITSLRISTHKLEIEHGSYQKPTPVPANERICRQCNSGCTEDEHHFMFECEKHGEERIILFREYGRKITDLYVLFLNCNEYQLRSIGKYNSHLYDETVIGYISSCRLYELYWQYTCLSCSSPINAYSILYIQRRK